MIKQALNNRFYTIPVFLLIAVLSFATLHLQGQDEEEEYNFWSLGLGAGITSLRSDVEPGFKLNLFNTPRNILYGSFEKRLKKSLGVDLHVISGSAAQSYPQSASAFNYEMNFLQAGVGLKFYLPFTTVHRDFTPFFGIDFNFMSYSLFSDTLDADGNRYHFWSDGSIRIAEEGEDLDIAETRRDYEYETTLSSGNSTITIPLTLGFEFLWSDRWTSKLSFNYALTMSDDLEGLSAENGNQDKMAFISVGLNHRFGGSIGNSDRRYKDVDFVELKNKDSDGDGIRDIDDECFDKLSGKSVTPNGCPIDEDMDGVPDYRDKQKNTPKGAYINDDGVQLNEQELLDLIEMFNKVTKVDRPVNKVRKMLYDPDENIQTVRHNTSNLPENLQGVDYNKNGVIERDEILQAIDDFFAGEDNAPTVGQIYAAIDYFFEQ